MITSINNYDEYENLINETRKCVVVFGTSTCHPCALQKELLEYMEKKNDIDGNIAYFKLDELDADLADELINKFEIRSFPTILLYRKGRLVHRCNQRMDREDIVKKL